MRLRDEGFGSEDASTRAAGLLPDRAYRIEDLIRDRHRVLWVKLAGITAPQRKYPGWAPFRFERVGAYDDAANGGA